MASTSKVDVWNRALDRIGVTDVLESEDEDRVEAAVCRRHYDDILREVLAASVWRWALRQMPLTEIGEQTYTYDGAATDGVETDFSIPFDFLSSDQVEVVLIGSDDSETVLEAGDDYTFPDVVEPARQHITLTVAPAANEELRITVTTTRVGWEHLYSLPADCVTPVAILYLDQRLSLLPEDSRVEFTVEPADSGTSAILCCDLESDDIDALQYVAYLDHVPLWPPKFLDAVAWRLSVELAFALPKDEAKAERNMQRYLKALDAASALAFNAGHDGPEPATPSRAARGG